MVKDIAKELALAALKLEAVKFSPEKPFCWASGYYMPIYNDNRLFLSSSSYRQLIAEGFAEVLRCRALNPDVIAGTATAGIPAATTLADYLKKPLIYIRSAAKGHGLQKRIEGVLQHGQHVVVVEDVISTGGSSIEVVQAVREAGGVVPLVLAVFSYMFENTVKQFHEADCELMTLLSFQVLRDTALECGYLSPEQISSLNDWYQAPFEWGAKRGFARNQT